MTTEHVRLCFDSLTRLGLSLSLALIAALLIPAPAEAEPPWTSSSSERTHAQVWLVDGSSVSVGQRGPITGDCTEGARAWVSRRAADGSLLWTRIVHADAISDGAAMSLFVGPGSPNPATVFGSTARDVAFDATTGTLIVVGDLIQVTVSSLEDPLPVANRRGFVLRLDIDGAVIQGSSVGQPFGDSPHPDLPSCESICARLQSSAESWRPRAVATTSSGDIVTTGGRRLADASNEAFLAVLTPHFDPVWDIALATGEPGEGRDVVVASVDPDPLIGETIYVTGTLGVRDRNVVVESYDTSGHRLASISSSGLQDDSGDSILMDGSDPVVFGRFNAGLEFGDHVLTAVACERNFRARFDRHLSPLGVEVVTAPVISGATQQPLASAIPRTSPSTTNAAKSAASTDPTLLGIRVLEGYWGGGGVCQLEESDDSYFSIAGEPTPTSQSNATFVASFDVSADAPTINQISFEFTSQYCTTVSLSLGGGTGDGYMLVASGSLCPMGEPIGVVPVPVDVSHALGFGGGGRAAALDLPLLLKVELSFHGELSCGQGSCTSGAKDGSVDELDLESGTDEASGEAND